MHVKCPFCKQKLFDMDTNAVVILRINVKTKVLLNVAQMNCLEKLLAIVRSMEKDILLDGGLNTWSQILSLK